ncbi:isocitrate lyase/phosphoenolpyruvate mutase family protein [Nocardioides sp. NPDC092400]|uniref:isocitrate lyase/PEP mutase family protein n=1 Tax=Nocardioides sp. NPDC092400 TaxID=3155196 RepID=UPI0034449A2B
MTDATADPTATADATADKARELLRLHREPELLTVVNVWDAISARVVADVPGTRALATASHSIAATLGYEDGENIPVQEMLDMVGRIVRATDLPVTADLEGGYGDAAGTVRRAIDVGVVGANLEDQLKPLPEAVRQVEQVMAVAEQAGVEFVLNARTDVFLRAGDRDRGEVLAEATERGRAFLDAGAPVVFVPGFLSEEEVAHLCDAFGPQRLTVIGLPGHPPLARLQELGVARISFGPVSQNVALTALQKMVEDVHRGGTAPEDTRRLN